MVLFQAGEFVGAQVRVFIANQTYAVDVAVQVKRSVVKHYLGSEIDLSIQYFISKQADLQVGYSTMFATESMEFIKGGSHKEPIHRGWVMLTVKPVFFNSGAPAQ